MFEHDHPADWTPSALYDLAEWVNGLAFRDIQFTPKGKPIIKIAELKGGISGQTRFTQDMFDESVHVNAGDMLFSWSGNPETSIDVFFWTGMDGWLNQHIFKLTPKVGVECRFLFYILKFLKPSFVRIASNKQTTGLGHVTVRDLKAMTVGLPRPEEQQAIIDVLAPLDDKIDLIRRTNATMESMVRTVFQNWFIDAAFSKLPDGWRELPLPEAIEVNPNRPLSKGQVAPYLDMANMPTDSHRALEIIDREFGSGMRFVNGDTLVARITPCLENGKTAYVDFLADNQVGWGSTEYTVLRPKPPLPTCFAYFLARTNGFRSFAIGNMTGSTGRQRVPADCFNKFNIVVPDNKTANAFGDFAQPILEKIKANDLQARTLTEIRDVLLPKLLSGEIRVPFAAEQVKEADK